MRVFLYIANITVVVGLLLAITQPWKGWGDRVGAPYFRPETVPVAKLDPNLPPDVAEILARAEVLFDQNRMGEALQLLRPHHNSGYMDVDALLGRIYLFGPLEIKNLDKARNRLLSASMKGHGASAYSLGRRLFDGDQFEQDIQQGLSLLEQAASCGLPAAKAFLGAAYYEGTNVPVDRGKAKRYTEFAAWAGIPEAQWNMAVFLFRDVNEIGRTKTQTKEQESKKAFDEFYTFRDGAAWLLVSARSGYKKAEQTLGLTLENLTDSEDFDHIEIEANNREDAILPADPYVCGFIHPHAR